MTRIVLCIAAVLLIFSAYRIGYVRGDANGYADGANQPYWTFKAGDTLVVGGPPQYVEMDILWPRTVGK